MDINQCQLSPLINGLSGGLVAMFCQFKEPNPDHPKRKYSE